MPWQPLPTVAFAICTYPFHSTQPQDLPLQIGDHIYIIEQGGKKNGWFRGYLVAPPSILAGLNSDRGQQLEHRVFSGIFPRNCVEVREFLGENQVNGQAQAVEVDRDEEEKDTPKSPKYARRLSRKLSRKRSARDLTKKGQSNLVPDAPMPRDPDAPKPLAPVPLLRVGDETGLSAEEPLVDEIASCLREWHDARLHEIVLARNYSQLDRIQNLVTRVDKSRKQLMNDVLTTRELVELREDTVWDLVAGNKMLNGDIIVRSPTEKGRVLTADDSIIEITKLQANMSILDRPPKPASDKHMLHHMLVDIRNLVFDAEPPATLQISLCGKEYGEPLLPVSENYALSLPIAATPEQEAKTLFVNLSGFNVGIGTERGSLYIVFRLLRDEPLRQVVYGQGFMNQTQNSVLVNGSAHRSSSSKGGRRSVFGSQKMMKAAVHGRSPSDATERPQTGNSEHSESNGRPSGASERPGSQALKPVRRTVGFGAVDVGSLARSQSSIENSITLWAPCTTANDQSYEAEDWMEVIRELSLTSTGGFCRVGAVSQLDIFAKVFASPELETLIRNTPTLLHGVPITPKLGFSGIANEKRSDIYLTLAEPNIPRLATLAHSKFGALPLGQRCQTNMANLQLTLEIRKMNGERIEDCIFTASNHPGHTAWRTVAIERGEKWNQTIRLAVPADEVPGCHVVMSIADTPNFPFALAWVPLWEFEAFVRDGDHQVTLYVYDEYSSSIVGGKGAYLSLPPWHDKNNVAQPNAMTVSLRTFLCSTEYSQDPTLLGLLNWRNYHGENLIGLLERFALVPDIEIVKLLSDVFGSLFEILHEYEGSENYEDLIFFNFVVVLNVARDKRFGLSNIIEEHAKTRYEWPRAAKCLLAAYQRLVSNPLDADSSRKMRSALKVGDQMLKLIIDTSKHNPDMNAAEVDDDDDGLSQRHPGLRSDLQKLFVAVMAVLRNPMPVLLGTQTLVIQHFHTWLPELTAAMAPNEIFEIATDLLDACAHAHGMTVLHRLILILNYSHVEVFKSPDIRVALVANTFRWLAPYWGHVATVTNEWRAQVRLCCSVLATQFEELEENCCQYIPKLTESFLALQRAEFTPKRTFSMLFPTSYPFPSKSTDGDIHVDEALLEVSTLLAAALTTRRELSFDTSTVDVSTALLQALKALQSILSCEAFPRSWMSLHVCHHRYGMTALEHIADALIVSLPDIYAPDAAEAFEFDTVVWRAFFDTLFTALRSPALAMETFPEQKRRAVWKIAGDVRELGANLLQRSWEAIGWETDEDSLAIHGLARLGGYQVQFVPELVGPIVELCMSVHASLRGAAVEVLRTMIISAWEIDQDLSLIQTAMIDCLDKLCTEKNVTESVLQKTFIPEMLEQFTSLQNTVEDGLYNATLEMFSKIEQLLDMLANVHQGDETTDASRLVETLHLMDFLRDVQSEGAFIRYVHQLADMQIAAGNYAEAGLALRMHADRYEWDPLLTLGETSEPKLPMQTAFERKEALYFEMCNNFERAKSWQHALAAYRELAFQYEQNRFDFLKLARAQRVTAGLYDKIAKGDRVSLRYFRVVYKGLGFPPSLRDKEFIYEGSPTDRMATFEDRMQQLHPTAQILRADAEAEVEGQFLRIYAVSPNRDLSHLLYQRTTVSQPVREYALLSNPRKFATTSRQTAHNVSITEQVVEKIIYTTAEEFPTIMRRSEITNIETMVLSPVEAAVERTTRKTQELLTLQKRISSGEDDGAMTRLSNDLVAAVDPESENSVARYRGLLPGSETMDGTSAEVDLSMFAKNPDMQIDPMQNALKVALLDHALAIKRCLGLYNRPAHLATKAELVARFEATFEQELAILFPNRDGLFNQDTPRSSLSEPDERMSRVEQHQQQQQQQQTAAVVQPKTNGEESQLEQRGRRRSLLFLGRSSSKQGRSQNPAAEDGETSRPGSRNRARDSSTGRRLSFFRTNSFADRPSADLLVHSSPQPRKLQKRRSFQNAWT